MSSRRNPYMGGGKTQTTPPAPPAPGAVQQSRMVEVKQRIPQDLLRSLTRDEMIRDPLARKYAVPTLQLSNLSNPYLALGQLYGFWAALDWEGVELREKPAIHDSNLFYAELVGIASMSKAFNAKLLDAVTTGQSMYEYYSYMPPMPVQQKKPWWRRLLHI